MASNSMEKEKEKMRLVGVGFLGALIVIVKFVKFLPALLLGFGFSFFITEALKSEGVARKVTNTLFNTLFLCCTLLFFVGYPFNGIKPQYNGFLPYWPLKGVIEWFITLHDSTIGQYKTTLFQEALIKKAHFFEVAQVFWVSLPISVILGLAFYFFGEKNDYGSKLSSFGLRFFRSLLAGVQLPIKWAMTVPWNPLSSGLVLFLPLIILLGIDSAIESIIPSAQQLAPVHILERIFLISLLPFTLFMFVMFMRSAPLILPGGHYIVRGVDFILSPLYGLLLIDIPNIGTKKRNGSGIRLGRDLERGREVFLTDKNLNYHTQVVGGSGAGKTNLIKNVIADRIHQGEGLIFLDLKADFETIEWIARATNNAHRSEDLKILSLTEPSISFNYNPMKRGGVSELHSKIMNSIKWSEEYYRKVSSEALHAALTLLCERRERYRIEFDLFELYEVVSFSGKMERVLRSHGFSDETTELIEARIKRLRERDGFKSIQGLSTDLYNLTRSAAGPMLKMNPQIPEIDLFDSISKGEIVYFLMDSMSDKESSEVLGRILLQDLILATGQIYKSIPESERVPTQVIIDEFASFATPNFIDFINRARGAGLGIMVAHQSRGDLREVSDNFCDRLERNCATKLIFGTDNDEDAEYFASMVGTRTTTKDTQQMEQGWFTEVDTGMISRREVEEFIVHPNEIKNLGQGEVLSISRLVDVGVNLLKIYMAPEFEGVEALVSVFERDQMVEVHQNNEANTGEITIEKDGYSPNDGEVFV